MGRRVNSEQPVNTPCNRAKSPRSTASAILVVNYDLPVFPGTGGHEHLNTTNLARLAGRVGLVSMVHRPEDLAKSQRFREAGVELYLWESPHMDARAPAAGRSRW